MILNTTQTLKVEEFEDELKKTSAILQEQVMKTKELVNSNEKLSQALQDSNTKGPDKHRNSFPTSNIKKQKNKIVQTTPQK